MSMFDMMEEGDITKAPDENISAASADTDMLLPPQETSLSLGHEQIEEQILSQINQGNLPHAMIFSGLKGIGKAGFAFRLGRYLIKYGVTNDAYGDAGDGGAMAGLFGDEPPPVTSPVTSLAVDPDDPVVRQIAAGGHPDFLYITRPMDERKGTLKSTLDVETVRKITPFLRKTAADGGWRVVLVDDADCMNHNAQNAILKILEEPPKHTLLILICHRLGAMIPTIRSRCRVIDFARLSDDHIATLMARGAGHDLDPEEQAILSFLSEGSIGIAHEIMEADGLDTAREVYGLLGGNAGMADIHKFAQGVTKDAIFDHIALSFLKMIEGIIFHHADGRPLPDFLSFMMMSNDASAQDPLSYWLGKYEAMKAHFDTARRGNLDKRLATLNGFLLFKE